MNVSRGRCLLGDFIQARGWTQAQYADKVNRHPRVISHFCQDERVMLPEDLVAASIVFQCAMNDFYEWDIELDIEE